MKWNKNYNRQHCTSPEGLADKLLHIHIKGATALNVLFYNDVSFQIYIDVYCK